MSTPVIRQDGEGEQLWFAGGGIFTMKASCDETGGSFSLWEDEMVRGKTTPLHLHPDFDEALYVLKGEIVMHVDGVDHIVGERGFALAPRGVPHAFLVTSETARILAVLAPGNAESFYRGVSEPITSPEDRTRPADFDRLLAAAQASPTIEVLGPPPFERAAEPAG